MGKFLKNQIPHNLGVRNDAKLKGYLRYFTGIPCKKGHIAERSVANGNCLVCSKENMAKMRRSQSKEKKLIELEKNKIRAAKWRMKNPNHENTKIAKKAYKIRNISKVRADCVKRRTIKANRTPKWLTVDDFWLIEQVYELASLRTKMFGFKWHVDHIIPLNGKIVSGLHVPKNLQVLPWIENVKKSNKFDGVKHG
jgi:hypothetical protein